MLLIKQTVFHGRKNLDGLECDKQTRENLSEFKMHKNKHIILNISFSSMKHNKKLCMRCLHCVHMSV